ncbi:hypothetical protein ANCCAN_27486 [Ancylostoma caninum]|uniref:Uncharacterized protein n=1 Tax=Ancylostoma caninum TaxID=29170 RepID=A0A368F9D1_ANCCA|nr:hypothetical protein ANCCAN_27486 [Ancylostoma caninum]
MLRSRTEGKEVENTRLKDIIPIAETDIAWNLRRPPRQAY